MKVAAAEAAATAAAIAANSFASYVSVNQLIT